MNKSAVDKDAGGFHIAMIDFPEFYKDAFSGSRRPRDFVRGVAGIPVDDSKAKIVIHQAARMLWLGDRGGCSR